MLYIYIYIYIYITLSKLYIENLFKSSDPKKSGLVRVIDLKVNGRSTVRGTTIYGLM